MDELRKEYQEIADRLWRDFGYEERAHLVINSTLKRAQVHADRPRVELTNAEIRTLVDCSAGGAYLVADACRAYDAKQLQPRTQKVKFHVWKRKSGMIFQSQNTDSYLDCELIDTIEREYPL